MGREGQGVYVEMVAKKKGCMLCDLAIRILEEITPDFATLSEAVQQALSAQE